MRTALLSLPNALSLSRFVLAPLFVVARQPELRVGLLVLAGATDLLDGWLARRQRTTSRVGALLDPIADRTFVLVAIAALVADGLLAPLQALLLLTRDLMTTIGYLVARVVPWLRAVEFRARLTGKAVTVLQLVTLLAALLHPSLVGPLVAATALTALVAVADYTLALWRARAR